MNDRVLALLTAYDQLLEARGIDWTPVVDRPDYDEGARPQLAHCRWMIRRLTDEGRSWSTRKVNRWLGFVQGVLWANGIHGILELRDQSRDLYPGSEAAAGE